MEENIIEKQGKIISTLQDRLDAIYFFLAGFQESQIDKQKMLDEFNRIYNDFPIVLE